MADRFCGHVTVVKGKGQYKKLLSTIGKGHLACVKEG